MATLHACFWCGWGRFEYASENDLRTITDTSRYTSGNSIDSTAGLCHTAKTCTVFKSFAGIDTHNCKSQMSLQFVKYRFSHSYRQTVDAAFDNPSDRVPVFLVAGNRVRKTSGIGFFAHLYQLGTDSDTMLRQLLLGNTSGYHSPCCLACGSSTSTSPIANTVFEFIYFVGMSYAVGVLESFVVFRPGICVANNECNRRT